MTPDMPPASPEIPASSHDLSTPATGNGVLAVDPGRDKCGIAVVRLESGRFDVLERCIVGPQDVAAMAAQFLAQHSIARIVLGDSTTSKRMAQSLREALPAIALTFVNEKGSTLEARALYWEANPPRGWRRALPLSLQEPPEPVDDFAAVVLARRFFAQQDGN